MTLLSVVQMNSQNDIEANFSVIESLMMESKAQGASLIVFPENFVCFAAGKQRETAARFDEFQNQLGMTRHLLAERLNRLVEHNIIEKKPYQVSPTRYEYKLTERGLALYPILLSFTKWGNDWMNEEQTHPHVQYIHKSCGKVADLIMTCQCCGEPLTRKNTSPDLG